MITAHQFASLETVSASEDDFATEGFKRKQFALDGIVYAQNGFSAGHAQPATNSVLIPRTIRALTLLNRELCRSCLQPGDFAVSQSIGRQDRLAAPVRVVIYRMGDENVVVFVDAASRTEIPS